MAKRWEELAGEQGKEIPSGRFVRMLHIGRLGLGVSVSTVTSEISRRLRIGRPEDRRAALRVFRREQADKVATVLGQLKGASMKVGQLLSQDPDLLPPEVLSELTRLQHAAPPMTWATIKHQVEGALDRPMEAVFKEFCPEPIGSASIGQVHRGVLRTGEEVAVKVQYPGIVETLDSDLDNLGSLLTMGRAIVERRRLKDYLELCRSAVLEEADYVAEARHLRRFHDLLAERDGVRAPLPFEQWTRTSVLTMELARGEKIDEALARMGPGPEQEDLLERFVETYSWMFHELFELHSDPHPGNFLVEEDGGIVWLDFGCVHKMSPHYSDGILDILDSCWQRDPERAVAAYLRLGFGGDAVREDAFDPELFWRYHQIILRPFLRDEPFDFGKWRIRRELQRFILSNPKMWKLVPPAEMLMYFRVVSGIKGLLGKTGGRLNVHRMAVGLARRRGKLSGDPLPYEPS